MGIFDEKSDLFTSYVATLQCKQRVMGGVPFDPNVMSGWLMARTGLVKGSDVHANLVLKTLRETYNEVDPESGIAPQGPNPFLDLPEDSTLEQIMQVCREIGLREKIVGFKHDQKGLYLEDRQAKALLKECISILYSGERWGDTSKGPKAYSEERVHVGPTRLYLYATAYSEDMFNAGEIEEDDPIWQDPSLPVEPITKAHGVHLQIGHVSGPQGPRSTLTNHQYVWRPRFKVQFDVTQDCIKEDVWPQFWALAQRIGIGAVRSQQFGSFDLIEWTKIHDGRKAGKSSMARTPASIAKIKAAEEAKEVVTTNGHAEPEVAREAVVVG